MNIIVLIKFVPDLVEELIVDANGSALDPSCVRLLINEFDDHAIEQAILLKEAGAGQVTVVAPDSEATDDALYAAAAKGADRLVKLTGDWEAGVNNHARARVFANYVKTLAPELILTGVQAHNDVDGAVGPQLAEHLGMPYVGYVAGVNISGDKAIVCKEFPGGLAAQMEVAVPAVLGIQAAAKPPRYVPISKIRQTMKTAKIETFPAAELETAGMPTSLRFFKPESGAHATMIDGDVDAVATKLVAIFREQGLL